LIFYLALKALSVMLKYKVTLIGKPLNYHFISMQPVLFASKFVNVATKDAKRNPQFAKELVEGGGSLKVPCLRIEENDGAVTWMYESSDIIQYLEKRFQLIPAS
jgi:glutathione S-transferase